MSPCPKRKRPSSHVGDGVGADGSSSSGGVGAADCAELNYEVELEAIVDASGGRYVLETLFKVCDNPFPPSQIASPTAPCHCGEDS
jgi:hypothetical protein